MAKKLYVCFACFYLYSFWFEVNSERRKFQRPSYAYRYIQVLKSVSKIWLYALVNKEKQTYAFVTIVLFIYNYFDIKTYT